MKDLMLLHWMLEECRKNKGSHKNCVCETANMPKFGDNSLQGSKEIKKYTTF